MTALRDCPTVPPVTHYAAALGRFDSLRQSWTRSGNSAWYGHCPVCGSRDPSSLRLWINDAGRLAAKCFAGGCKGSERRQWFRDLLAAVGSAAAEWFPDDAGNSRREARRVKIDAVYDWRDAQGRLLFQCVKLAPGERQKCLYRRPAHADDDPARVRADRDGRWVWDGQAVDPDKLALGEIAPAPPVLYRLPDLLAAPPRQPVLYCEGEPDAEAARALGLVATTNAHGAGNLDPAAAPPLAGRRVSVLEDNDDAGRRHARLVAGVLLGAGAAGVRVVTLRRLPEHADLCDWLKAAVWPALPRSAKAAGWIAGLPAGERQKGWAAVGRLVRAFPEWAPLLPANGKE